MYLPHKPRDLGCRHCMVGDLEIGLCVAAVPAKGNESLHSYIGWNYMLQCRRTEKDGLDVRVFRCERFRIPRECQIIEAASMREDVFTTRRLYLLPDLLCDPVLLLHKRLDHGDDEEDRRGRIF